MIRKALSIVIFIVCIPAVCIVGTLFFKDKSASFISAGIGILMLGGYFLHFESRKIKTSELVIIAVMSALSVVGRIIFVFTPSLKPCTAVIILTAIYFGRESGFMVGALTALVSNFYFGQGGWTPFQMLAWGITGYLAGVFGKWLIQNKILLMIFSALSGLLFSAIMDLWSTLWFDGTFNLSRFLTLTATSAAFSLAYAVSNCIFVLILMKPSGRTFARLCKKYDMGTYKGDVKI